MAQRCACTSDGVEVASPNGGTIATDLTRPSSWPLLAHLEHFQGGLSELASPCASRPTSAGGLRGGRDLDLERAAEALRRMEGVYEQAPSLAETIARTSRNLREEG